MEQIAAQQGGCADRAVPDATRSASGTSAMMISALKMTAERIEPSPASGRC